MFLSKAKLNTCAPTIFPFLSPLFLLIYSSSMQIYSNFSYLKKHFLASRFSLASDLISCKAPWKKCIFACSQIPWTYSKQFLIPITSPNHRKSKRVPEKHLLLLYWLHQSLWLCGSQKTVENSERDGNTRPPDPPLEKSVCRSGSNS